MKKENNRRVINFEKGLEERSISCFVNFIILLFFKIMKIKISLVIFSLPL